jgi:Tol biopolymer transport system component
MDADGGNPKQLTSGPLDQLPVCSPDGKWVVYQSRVSGKNTIWKVPIEGGDPAQLSDSFGTYPVLSPDGKLMASIYLTGRADAPFGKAITPLDGGTPAKTMPSPLNASGMHLWTPDGSAIAQIVSPGGVSNIWSYPIAGGTPTQLTNFNSGLIYRFDWSRDGKQLLLARGTQTRDVVLINNIR